MTLQEHYDEKYNEGYADGLKLVRPSFSLKRSYTFFMYSSFFRFISYSYLLLTYAEHVLLTAVRTE